MIIFLYGDDIFRSRQYLHQLIDQFKRQRDPQGYNVIVLDGKKEPSGRILSELHAAPFLAEKRMVVVENILSGNDKELLSTLREKIQIHQLPQSTVVIFWQGETLGKTKEVKELQAQLSKEQYAQEFLLLEGAKLAAWIVKTAEDRGGKIEQPAAEFLAQNSSGDGWLISTTIDELTAFKAGDAIRLDDVQLFLEKKFDDNVFSMIEAVVQRNYKNALTLLAYQRTQGEEDGKIFGLLLWQFRVVLEIADAREHEQNLTSDTAARVLGLSPFVVKKNWAVSQQYSAATLRDVYQKLLDIDWQTKTGASPQSVLLDVFIRSI